MIPPKCKICGECHWGMCRKFAKPKVAATAAQARAKEIAARPVKLGSKGKAKKAKRAKTAPKPPAAGAP